MTEHIDTINERIWSRLVNPGSRDLAAVRDVFKNLPTTQWEFGWLVVSIGIVALDLVAYFMFRRRGWLGRAARQHSAGDDV